jgi:hypothetical protein
MPFSFSLFPPLCLQIPFDKITDCDIVEPAGNSCVCIPNTLYSVHIDTASSEKGSHELNITGLKDPHAFKRLVWAMKRATVDGHPAGACLPAALEMVDRGSSSDEVAILLREIRDELRQQKEVFLQGQRTKPPAATTPSAPFED